MEISGDYFIDANIRHEGGQEHVIPRCVIRIVPNEVIAVPVINLSVNDLVINQKVPFIRANLCHEDKIEQLNVLSMETTNITEFSDENFNFGLKDQEVRQRLLKLINNKYRHCFSMNVEELGASNNTEMHINLADSKPITYRPYRMAMVEKEAVKGIIGELLNNGIIRESESDFSSPVLLVKKINGEYRMCVDFRKLNTQTVKDKYPLPRIDDQIDKLHRKKHFTTLDMTSGYHQVRVAETSKKYTAFVTPEGHYEYNRMPFGLCNAPSVFQQVAFNELKQKLILRPILAIYNPNANTEVHCDASSSGLAGILMQEIDRKWHPVYYYYYSRNTTEAETKYHSFELEALAVVETLKKFRVYLLGRQFKVVTDCSAITTANNKKDLVPRIARWWLTIQDYTFTIEHRSGNKMQHVDCLSRSPIPIMKIEAADWVLSAQMTDEKIQQIKEILSQEPTTDYEKNVYKNYALRNGRVYRITVKGVQWVVPQGMRRQVVQLVYDNCGHFSLEKAMEKLTDNYWFPRMREYVKKYLQYCIPCLYTKNEGGKHPGLLNPIEKVAIPFHTIHLDHLGPFVKTKKNNIHLIVLIDAFTKFCILKPVRSTKTKGVIQLMQTVVKTFGVPNRIITDRGTCYTSKRFENYCKQIGTKHILNAVATPRANGQVEKYNRTILSSMTALENEDEWDKEILNIQFALNNTTQKTTKATPSEILLGYKPKSSTETILLNEVQIDQVRHDLK